MTDTNGNVAPAHLALSEGFPVSIAILSDLRAAAAEFEANGYTFGLVWGDPGYRSIAIQKDERIHPAAHNITAAMAKRLAPVGQSRHGFGRAIDVFSDAPLAERDRILAKHGFKPWKAWDRNHYEWGNVLVAADVSRIPLDNTTTQEDPMAGPYRLFSRTDNSVTTLALGILDPAWQVKGHNFWAEAEASQRVDWEQMWGPSVTLRNDIWDSRSNDPNRISDLTKFPMIGAGGTAPAIDYAALAKAVNDDAARRLAN